MLAVEIFAQFSPRYSPQSSSHRLVIHVRLVFVHTPQARHCLRIDQFENTCETRDKISVRQAGRRKRGKRERERERERERGEKKLTAGLL